MVESYLVFCFSLLVLPSCKAIVYHIPKCGGTTVAKVFRRFLQPSDYIIYDKYVVNGQNAPTLKIDSLFASIPKHSTFEESCYFISKLFPSIEFNHIFISRSPYSRLKSAFTFLKDRHPSGRLMHRGISHNLTEMRFLDFLSSNMVGNSGCKAAHPQSQWLPLSDNFQKTTFKLESFSQRGQLLKFLRFFPTYCDNISPEMFSRKHSNKSNPLFTPLSDERACVDIINDIYSEDFLRFSYPKHY